jgi:hypothetical protein
MSADESFAWLQSAIAHERAVAASWSLAGWPAEANYYRRNALKAMRILRRVTARPAYPAWDAKFKAQIAFCAVESIAHQATELRRAA